jgi:hypothetical protein
VKNWDNQLGIVFASIASYHGHMVASCFVLLVCVFKIYVLFFGLGFIHNLWDISWFFIGVLLRKLEGGLRGVSHVIVDEIHERDINVRGCELETIYILTD